MRLSINQKVNLKIAGQISLTGVLLGLIYVFFANGPGQLYPFVNGALAGLLVGMLISWLELYFFSRGAKKLRFITLLGLRTIIYLMLITIIIFNVVVISRMVRFQANYLEVVQSADFKQYIYQGNFSVAVIYSLIFAFSINFVRMISRKMGQGMLISYISGTYYQPVREQRIVMFMDVEDSKKIAKNIGPLAFHQFLQTFFYDLTVPVVTNNGKIYEYVEDLMVVTWAMKKGLAAASCLKTYFAIKDTIAANKTRYQARYGFVPRVKAGIHTGPVVRAEIGEIKTQIVFHGDTMNTTARILGKCHQLGLGLVASEELLGLVELPAGYAVKSVGEIDLRGKEKALGLTEILRKEVNDG